MAASAKENTARASDAGWCWRRFGDTLMLVTEAGGAQVVLAPARRKTPGIETRDPVTGVLRPIREDDAAARLIAAAPNLLHSAKDARAALAVLFASTDSPQHKAMLALDAAIAKVEKAA
jgi:hypothetical protein